LRLLSTVQTDNVHIPSLLLIVIIVLTPVVLIFDGTAVYALLLALAAVGVAFAALYMPSDEARRLQKLILPATILTAVPALWMLVQIAPFPFSQLTHPIWQSAATALGGSTRAAISIDPGASTLSFSKYISSVGIFLLAAMTGADRRSAKWSLYTLTATTTLISVFFLCFDLFDLKYFHLLDNSAKRADALDAAAFGLILSTSTGTRIYEREEMRLTQRPHVGFRRNLALCAAAFVFCLTALILGRSKVIGYAALYGLGAILAITLIRRLNLGGWGLMGFVAIAILGAVAIFATSSGNPDSDLTLVLGSQSRESTLTARQILSDAPLLGTGAGTYAALVPIYRTSDENQQESIVPTAAAAISVELGRPMLWYTFVGLAIGSLVLFQGALRRGRDSYYPAAGTACLIASYFLLLGNPGLLSAASASLAAATVGLATSQSQSSRV